MHPVSNSTKPSILLLGSQMATGGAQRVLLDQAQWFHQRGYKVVAAFFHDREGLHTQWQAQATFPIVNLRAWRAGGGLGNIFGLLPGLWRAWRLMRREQFTVVECFTQHANILGIPLAWLARVPVRVVSHHSRLENFPEFLTRFQSWLVNHRWAQRIVVVSKRVQAIALEEGVRPELIVVIRNGIQPMSRSAPEHKASQRLAEELSLRPGELLILNVGRLREQKGQSYLLDAIPLVVKNLPGVVFAIAGDGPLRSDLEEKARKLGIDHAVRFLGNRTDIPQLLAAADVFVLPSLWEGLPIALLEAMQAGLPSVVTNVEGVDEIITDQQNGLVVPVADPLALADALVTVLQDSELRARLGRSARQLVEAEYTVDQMCLQYEALFLSLMDTGS